MIGQGSGLGNREDGPFDSGVEEDLLEQDPGLALERQLIRVEGLGHQSAIQHQENLTFGVFGIGVGVEQKSGSWIFEGGNENTHRLLVGLSLGLCDVEKVNAIRKKIGPSLVRLTFYTDCRYRCHLSSILGDPMNA